MIKTCNSREFNEINQNDKLLVIDFYANWCSPCKMVMPLLEDIAQNNKSVEFIKINIDESIDIAQRYNVTTIPTIIGVKHGVEQERLIGFNTREKIQELVDNLQNKKNTTL